MLNMLVPTATTATSNGQHIKAIVTSHLVPIYLKPLHWHCHKKEGDATQPQQLTALLHNSKKIND